MVQIILSLAIVNVLLLAGVAASGYAVGPNLDTNVHVAFGIVGTVFTVLVHSLVFIYFMGAGKSLKEGVLRKGLDPSILDTLPKLRGQAFPWAWTVCLVAAATAIIGGGVWSGMFPGWIHQVLGITTFAVNLAALPVELRAVYEHGRIIEKVEAQLFDLPQDAQEFPVEEHLGPIPPAKGFLLTGFSVWAVYFYVRLVMQKEVDAFPWFVGISAVAIALGAILIWKNRKKGSASPTA